MEHDNNQQNQEIVATIYNMYYNDLKLYLLSYTHDVMAAEDMLQDLFLKVMSLDIISLDTEMPAKRANIYNQIQKVNGPTMNVTMGEDKQTLQEVVVVGYGVQKKESLTGAVTVVDAKAFQEKGGLSSPLQALQGQVPGVMITSIRDKIAISCM